MSDRFTVYIPDDLKARLENVATEDRRSLNQQILHYCEEGLKKRDAALATQGDWPDKCE